MNIVQPIGGPVAITIIAIFLQRRVTTQTSTGNLLTVGPDAAAFTATLWLLCTWNALNALIFLAALRLPTRATSKARTHSQAPALLAEPAEVGGGT